jgi:hypothetical protein
MPEDRPDRSRGSHIGSVLLGCVLAVLLVVRFVFDP